MIDADGNQLGVMSARDAQKLADEKNLDLVKIAPTAVPPVCRIMDYGKYRFEQMKKEKEARKNQHVVDIKEIRLGLNTDVGDLNTKVRHAARFIEDGNKVKVSIRFRGREMGHPEIGHERMKAFAARKAGGPQYADVPCPEARCQITVSIIKEDNCYAEDQDSQRREKAL